MGGLCDHDLLRLYDACLCMPPHTVRLTDQNLIFTSILRDIAIPVSDIVSVKKARLGFGIQFDYRRDGIKVSHDAVNHRLIEALLEANQQIRLTGL